MAPAPDGGERRESVCAGRREGEGVTEQWGGGQCAVKYGETEAA